MSLLSKLVDLIDDYEPSHPTDVVLCDIGDERDRQEGLKAAGKFSHTCADTELTDDRKLVILVEEVGEVARAIQSGDWVNLRDELVQVAAVACAWAEALDKDAADGEA